MDDAQADRAAFDTAERLLGAPLVLPLGPANHHQALTSGGSPPGTHSGTPGHGRDSTCEAGRSSR